MRGVAAPCTRSALAPTCLPHHPPPLQAEQALRMFNNSLPAAASFLVSLGPAAAAALGAALGAAGAPPPAMERPSSDGWATDSGGSEDGEEAQQAPQQGLQQGSDGLPSLASSLDGSDDNGPSGPLADDGMPALISSGGDSVSSGDEGQAVRLRRSVQLEPRDEGEGPAAVVGPASSDDDRPAV